MSFVLDASVTFAWQFPDEETGPVLSVVERLLNEGAVVPVHWCAEVANGFAIAVRRGRISSEYRAGALERMPYLPIETDQGSAVAFWNATQNICDKHVLSAYDAAYLETALRRRLPIATLDRKLADAAKTEGVEVLGLTA